MFEQSTITTVTIIAEITLSVTTITLAVALVRETRRRRRLETLLERACDMTRRAMKVVDETIEMNKFISQSMIP